MGGQRRPIRPRIRQRTTTTRAAWWTRWPAERAAHAMRKSRQGRLGRIRMSLGCPLVGQGSHRNGVTEYTAYLWLERSFCVEMYRRFKLRPPLLRHLVVMRCMRRDWYTPRALCLRHSTDVTRVTSSLHASLHSSPAAIIVLVYASSMKCGHPLPGSYSLHYLLTPVK
jgi:hypothetical protein